MSLSEAIRKIAKTAASGPPAGPRDDARRHAAYHRRIVLAGCCSAAVGAALGLCASYLMASAPDAAERLKMIATLPVAFGVAGFSFGMAGACLVAPRAFLDGP